MQDLASVYGLKDTRDKKVFYIGTSIDPYTRYGQHLAMATRGKSPKDDHILDMRKDKALPELVILEENLATEQALIREKFWIQYHLDLGISLTNVVQYQSKKCKGYGKAGRLSTATDYALKWVRWEQTGFDPKQCPWKNPYEMKKHKPAFYEYAREILARES